MPTRTAATIVPMPTLPRECKHTRQVIKEIETIVTSKATLTVGKGFLMVLEIASIAPSPASGMISAGTYQNSPKAISPVLNSIMASRTMRFVGSGKNTISELQKVVKYPNRIPAKICNKFFA